MVREWFLQEQSGAADYEPEVHLNHLRNTKVIVSPYGDAELEDHDIEAIIAGE